MSDIVTQMIFVPSKQIRITVEYPDCMSEEDVVDMAWELDLIKCKVESMYYLPELGPYKSRKIERSINTMSKVRESVIKLDTNQLF
jgi:hypothetical protein